MPDYVYLLENRLSADQRLALTHLRSVAREAGIILFLSGDAVRDLTSGHAVRELEVAIHGDPLKLKKSLEKVGAKIWGEDEPSRSLYLCFPGTVRVDLISTHRVEYPKPGKPVNHSASIHEDLRRRDFTANSMAISLNEGSFGLLMDPLNGAADVEARVLRLVSNYGFLDDPSLLIRATRYRARLGWEMDMRTQARYDNAKTEGVIESISEHARSQELEQIGHEEDALKVLRALEDEGWMKVLFPAWTPAKADEAKLTALHELAVRLQLQGVHPDMSAAQMQLLTAKLPAKDLSTLKKSLLRPGFVEEWNKLDSLANGFSKVLLAKQNAKPSASYKLFMSYDPEAILWLGFTSKSKDVQERFNLFLKVWPEALQRIPYALMQEMRITQELPAFAEIVHGIFLELIDGKLTTPEEMRAYLEPHSPPAPPPQVTVKRPRARRGAEARVKERAIEEDEDSDDRSSEDDDLDAIGTDDDEIDLGSLPRGPADTDLDDEEESEEDEDLDEERAEAPGRKRTAPGGKKAQNQQPVKPEKTTAKSGRPQRAAEAKPSSVAKSGPGKPAGATAIAKATPARPPVVPAPKAKPVPPSLASKTAKPSPKPSVKPQPKHLVKAVAKTHPKIGSKPAPAKKSPPAAKAKPSKHVMAKPSKAPPKKPASKSAKKR